MDFLAGKKTFIVNIVTILLASAGAISDSGWVNAETMLYVVAVLNIVLRMVTTGPASWVSIGNNT